MKKRRNILTALAVVISLTACGSTTETQNTGEKTAEEETAAEETAGSSDSSSEETDAGSEEATEGVAGETYTGTVAAISEDSITVSTENDGSVYILLSSDTKIAYGMSGGAGGMGEDGGPGGDGEQAPDGDGAPDGEGGEGGPGGEGGEGSEEGGPGDAGDGIGADAAPMSAETDNPDAGIATLELPEGEDTIGGMNQGEDGSFHVGTGDGTDGGQAPDGGDGQAPDGAGSDGGPGGEGGDEGAPGDAGTGGRGGDGGDGEQIPDGDGVSGGEGGDPGEMGEGGMETVTLTWEDIAEGDTVTVVVGEDGTASSITLSMSMDGEGGIPGGMGGSDGVDSYTAVYAYTEDTEVDGESITSTGADENAVLVATGGITVTLEDVTITRDSDDSTGGDNSSFYGVGAAALVTDGTLVIEDSVIDSDAAGGAGVFAYGDGVAYVEDTTITTEQDTSGGIHVAGGGTLYGWDLTVDTGGESSAAIRSDRGSGTMVVDGGTYTTNWTGSPAVYSTADITVHDATLTANMSEAVCIEGLNTIRLFDCDLTGTMQDLETNDCIWTVILYQSMSGDSEVGNSTFEMVGGTLTSNSGGLFYTTNTESTFFISGVDITYSDTDDFLLKVTGNANQRGWGTSGANGAQCTFTAADQELAGTVIWDTISELDFYLTDDSVLTGAFVDDETNAGDGGDGYANVYISEDSTWIVTGDSTVSGLYNAGTITDEAGSSVTIIDTDGNVLLSGDSGYTITVTSYSTEVDLSGAGSAESWEDFEVEEIDD